MKKIFIFLFISFFYTTTVNSNTNNEELYKKIDLFAEVLEKIRKEYVDEVDQSELIDDAINGALQSLDPYSAYMDSDLFESMETDTKGEFGGLGIEILEYINDLNKEIFIIKTGLVHQHHLLNLKI